MIGAGRAEVPAPEPAGGAVASHLRPRYASKGARMLSWQDAHRLANIAAAQAHANLTVDLTGSRVDVVGAIHRADIALMWQPLPNLFGAFLNEPGSIPGIIINTALPRGARRHTAAHELGHAHLAHSTSVDDGSTIDTALADEGDAIPQMNRRRTWPDQEKLAEAFAAWFLMPRRVVTAALRVLNLDRPQAAEDVYRLSLLLGTSYRTTLRHLPNLRKATTQSCNAWARTAPGIIKARIDRAAVPPPSRRHEVWQLTPRYNGLRLDLQPGDRIVLPTFDVPAGECPEWLRPVPPVDPSAMSGVLEVGSIDGEREFTLAGPGASWSVILNAAPAPLGLESRRPR